MNWIFCPFVSRSRKRQGLASYSKSRASSSVPSLIISVPDFWCVRLRIGEVSLSHQPSYHQLLALPSAAKQQIEGSDLRRAPCAALFHRTGYGFVSVVVWCCFAVASFLCPSFLQRFRFPCALSGQSHPWDPNPAGCGFTLRSTAAWAVPSSALAPELYRCHHLCGCRMSRIKEQTLVLSPDSSSAVVNFSRSTEMMCHSTPCSLKALQYLTSLALQNARQCLGGLCCLWPSVAAQEAACSTVRSSVLAPCMQRPFHFIHCPLCPAHCPWERVPFGTGLMFQNRLRSFRSRLFPALCLSFVVPRWKPSDLRLNRYWYIRCDLRTFKRY